MQFSVFALERRGSMILRKGFGDKDEGIAGQSADLSSNSSVMTSLLPRLAENELRQFLITSTLLMSTYTKQFSFCTLSL